MARILRNPRGKIRLFFFSCVVAVNLWAALSQVVDRCVGIDFFFLNKRHESVPIGLDFETIGTCWLSNRKFTVINICVRLHYGHCVIICVSIMCLGRA